MAFSRKPLAEPAALEITRPRLPWWTLLPTWAKLALLPVALVWSAGWLAVRTVHLTVRYPVGLFGPLLGWVGYVQLGGRNLAFLVAVAGIGLGWWAWGHRSSFVRFCWCQVRTEWRRSTVYGWQWRSVMRLADLTKSVRGAEYRPKLGRVRADGWRDRVRVRMVKAQAPEQWELRASGLAHAFGATACRVRVRKPGRLELDMIHRDPLARPIPVPGLAAKDSAVDLKRLIVGRTETGRPFTLRLLGNHLLMVGSTGAGKGSVMWSLIWALAPAIRAGLVRLVGIDPKGGMELGQAPELFHRLAYTNGSEAVEVLEALAEELKERAQRYRGLLRRFKPGTGEPFTVLVIDELADVIAYQTDKALRERAARAVQTIASQGRAPGFAVVASVQDPRKEIVSFRHLFGTKVALRLDEAAQVDMVLGEGVRQRGAAAQDISEATPGVAWVKVDGRKEPLRARAFHVADADLARLVDYVTGRDVVHAEVLPFPGGGYDVDGEVAA
ncbi:MULTISPECIES: FtsK/SpoIIIE domain-containing protein [unclassified Crossiella]|uniref:FtsK/SpoIIIE domain-containing protein n=1 Tax=unclassified Crossiella TaxID=2620835 RepID=UPI001FFED490|nr:MULTISPECIES: FtsK/SpoIIIE domain-containing protein [unclassified Crossiella]MCK2237822.1 cell division protein FtsK [Crossiella sp. S99.2]MCK2255108.1 cell division protein FtsK [Crossiella sp. S99.1]